MKRTLLELVQSILSSLDGEEVNTISDTVESQQIVEFIKSSYNEIVASANLPQQYSPFQLDSSTNPNQPVVMTIPANINDVRWIKYNKTTELDNRGFQDVEFQPLEDFLRIMYSKVGLDNVDSLSLSLSTGNFKFYFYNNKMPDCYTVLQDNILVFDSYDSSVETTLQSVNTSCFGEVSPVFIERDDFVLNLTPNEFALLENEAKSQAFVEQKQTTNPKAEKRARQGWIRTQREKINIPYQLNSKLSTTANFGRKGTRNEFSRYLRNGR